MAREQHARRWTVKRSHLFFALTSLGLVTVMILYGDVSTSIDLQLFDQDANDIEVQETANFEEIFETTVIKPENYYDTYYFTSPATVHIYQDEINQKNAAMQFDTKQDDTLNQENRNTVKQMVETQDNTFEPEVIVNQVLSDLTQQTTEVKLGMSKNFKKANNISQPFIIDTPGCRIPDLPTRPKSLLRLFKNQQVDPKCHQRWSPMTGKLKQRGPPLIASNLTSMWIVHSALPHYKIKNISDLSCCYRAFSRVTQRPDEYNGNADKRVKYSESCDKITVNQSTQVRDKVEFVRVECSLKSQDGKSRPIFRDFHAFVPRKPQVEERCVKAPNVIDKLSVLILGIDSISRLNMERQLPVTRKLLLSPPLSAVSLLGYNKVGDNTFPNLIPMLTSLDLDELTRTCWPALNKNKLDGCPFIWKKFAAAGYRTVYGEDCARFSTFNYVKTGFVEQPTDYYTRPLEYESLSQLGHRSVSGGTQLCTGPRQSIELVLDYVRKFTQRFSNEPYFGMFWMNSISHNDLNTPHIGDKLIADTLSELITRGTFNQTVFIFISDHGMRWGKFRDTYQGWLEERLPLAYFSLPERFKTRFPEAAANLNLNAQRLTSPYDVHETLRDLLSMGEESRTWPEIWNNNSSNVSRGISLFAPISTNRACQDAGIDPQWCTCQLGPEVNTPLSVIQQAVNFLMSDMNKRLRTLNGSCVPLKLTKIKSWKSHELDKFDPRIASRIVQHLVTFRTNPGGGMFEATVRQIFFDLSVQPAFDFERTGTISRLNTYSRQSHCVKRLKLYCYCKDLMKS